MRSRLLNILLAITAACVVGLGLTAAVAVGHRAPRARESRAIVLRPRFRLVDSSPYVQQVLTDGHYVFFEHSPSTIPAGILIDEQTGKQTTITDPPGCYFAAIGGPWMLFDCAPEQQTTTNWKLYRLSSGRWRNVPSISIQSICTPYVIDCAVEPIGVGADWIETQSTTCYHCGGPFVNYVRIQGRNRLAIPPAAARLLASERAIPDMNRPDLAEKLCAPLRVPTYQSLTGPGLADGTITLYGRFAVVLTQSRSGELVSYLERCGSHLHRLIDALDIVGNSTMIVWFPSLGAHAPEESLNGMFLPSEKRFRIAAPASVEALPLDLAMDSRNDLFVNASVAHIPSA